MHDNLMSKLTTSFRICFTESRLIAFYLEKDGAMTIWNGSGRIADLTFKFNEDGFLSLSLKERIFNGQRQLQDPRLLFHYCDHFNPYNFSKSMSKTLCQFAGGQVNFSYDCQTVRPTPHP